MSAVTETMAASRDASTVIAYPLNALDRPISALISGASPITPLDPEVPSIYPSPPPLKTSQHVSTAIPQNDISDASRMPPTSPPVQLKKRVWSEQKPLQKKRVGFIGSSGLQELVLPENSKWPMTLRKVLRRQYKYTRIYSHQVRLLYIKPGAFDDMISASLLVLNDSDLDSDDYPYIALSYNWGGGEHSNTIIIQDDPLSKPVKPEKHMADVVNAAVAKAAVAHAAKEQILYIKSNLHEALRHFRDEKEPTAVWIDALCIDQSDRTEKQEQVAKMAKIYRKAYNVNIWLGSDDDSEHPISGTAMKFIEEVVNPVKHSKLMKNDAYIKHWACLFELLRWRWFSRKWIIQEIALAQHATVHCGNHKCSWTDFQVAISIFRQKFNILKPKLIAYFRASPFRRGTYRDDSVFEIEQLGANILVEMTSTLFRITRSGSLESTQGLETLVCLLSGFDTSDPRDTINAVRNIAKELNRPDSDLARTVPAPDYGKDLFEVYRDFVKWVIQYSKSVDILCRHWALKELKDPKLKTPTTPRLVLLPSWIQFVENSAWGKGADVFNGRKAGDSFVGLPGSNNYHACGLGASRKEPVVQFPPSAETISDAANGPNDAVSLSEVNHDTSILIRGITIGTVSFRTASFPDGVITRECLNVLGLSFDEDSDTIDTVPAQLWQTLVADRDHNGKPLKRLDEVACKYALKELSPNGHLNIDKILSWASDSEDIFFIDFVKPYLERVRAVTWDRRCIEGVPATLTASQNSDKGREKLVGFAPSGTKVGDVIAILYGCSVPVILRPRFDGDRLEAYEFLGEAYIDGKMQGEAFDEDFEFEEQDFKLI